MVVVVFAGSGMGEGCDGCGRVCGFGRGDGCENSYDGGREDSCGSSREEGCCCWLGDG